MTSSNSHFSCLSVLIVNFQRCEPVWPLGLTPTSSSVLLLLLDFHSLRLILVHPGQRWNSFQMSYSEDKFFSRVDLFPPPLPDLASMPQRFSCFTVLFHRVFVPGTRYLLLLEEPCPYCNGIVYSS